MILKSAKRLCCRSLRSNTFSGKGHNSTPARNLFVGGQNLRVNLSFQRARDNSHGRDCRGWFRQRRKPACGAPRSGFPRAIKDRAGVTRGLPADGYRYFPPVPRSFRFLRQACGQDMGERREIAGISRHLLTKRARSLPPRRSRRPSLYATRTFAFVLTSRSSLSSPVVGA